MSEKQFNRLQQVLRDHYDGNVSKGKKQFEQLNTMEQSKNLTNFFCDKVLAGLGYSDAAEEYEYGDTDGSKDIKCDAILKVGKQVHIIQTKFTNSKNKSMDGDDVEEITNIFNRLGNKSHVELANKKVKEIIKDIDYREDSFFLWFITNADLSETARAVFDGEPGVPETLKENGLAKERIHFEYFDNIKILNAYENLQSSDERGGVELVEIKSIKGQPIIKIEEENIASYLMIVESEQLANLARSRPNRARLFDFNIRNFLGSNKKNQEIQKTAKETPQNFYFFNNGVSAVCESISVDGEKVQATRFSIINGAQTVKCLTEAKISGKQPKVLLRITSIPNFKAKHDFISNIVKSNNTQNEIKASDFRSNDPIQKNYIEMFSNVFKDSKKCIYVPKRVDVTDRRKGYAVLMEKFGRTVFEYINDDGPFILAAEGVSSLFHLSDTKENYYEQIFGKPDGVLKKDEFETRAGIYFLNELITKMLKKEKESISNNNALTEDEKNNKNNALERSPIVLWAMNKIFKNIESDAPEIFTERRILTKILDLPSIELSDADKIHNFLSRAFEAATSAIIQAYNVSRLPHRRWIKGYGTTKQDLKNSLNNSIITRYLLSEYEKAFPHRV
jgi:hypothetical protein